MRNIIIILLSLCLNFGFSQNLEVPVDTSVTTQHKTTIKGVPINYTAETGMQPVWDKKGTVIASLFLHLLHSK